jgi:serine/threonine protein kinase
VHSRSGVLIVQFLLFFVVFSLVKVARTHLSAHEYSRFEQEARIIAGLVHPRIVRLLEFDLLDGLPFLIVDYAPQGSLRERHPKGVQLPLEQVVSYIGQVAEALQYAHDCKVIHRDVKPANLLIGRQGEILLSDFGIATVAHRTSSLSLQSLVGTPPYMAPEQLQGKPRPASDQYALGVVAYGWLAGELPFQSPLVEIAPKQLLSSPPSLREKNPNISAATEHVLMTALARESDQRFPTVQAFAESLEATIPSSARISNSPADQSSSPGSQRPEIPPAFSQPPKPGLSKSQPSFPVVGRSDVPAWSQPIAGTVPPNDAHVPVQSRTGDGNSSTNGKHLNGL